MRRYDFSSTALNPPSPPPPQLTLHLNDNLSPVHRLITTIIIAKETSVCTQYEQGIVTFHSFSLTNNISINEMNESKVDETKIQPDQGKGNSSHDLILLNI